jgi:hypothetical protein
MGAVVNPWADPALIPPQAIAIQLQQGPDVEASGRSRGIWMFGHLVSKVGYVLAVLTFILIIVNTAYRLPNPIQTVSMFMAFLGVIVSFCAVFLGVIARGFERVEAAIREQRVDGRS